MIIKINFIFEFNLHVYSFVFYCLISQTKFWNNQQMKGENLLYFLKFSTLKANFDKNNLNFIQD